MKKIFISWAEYSARSQNMANHFSAKDIYVYPFNTKGYLVFSALRYIVSFFLTLNIFLKEKADIIFALNQPLPLLFVVHLYTKITGKAYILDSHSNPFNHPRLAWQLPFYKYFAKKALININTNSTHQKLVQSWGGKSYIIGDVPIEFKNTYPKMDVKEISIAVVASFDYDEPIEEIFQAARTLNYVQFYITGNYKKAKNKLPSSLTTNLELLGFIPREEYISLLKSVKAVMALTIRDNTMQRGAYEALSLEKPIVTSDWKILRDSFGKGALYVSNYSDDIVLKVNQLLSNYEYHKKKIIEQKIMRKEKFLKTKYKIIDEINNSI